MGRKYSYSIDMLFFTLKDCIMADGEEASETKICNI